MVRRREPSQASIAKATLLLRSFRIDSAKAGERAERLPFLSHGAVANELRRPLTFLIGENGSGKTTLLEAIAACCAIRPGGGQSYAQSEDDREPTAISAAVDLTFAGPPPIGYRPKGLFLRADRFAEMITRVGRIPMATTGEWRLADEQSRGEGVLSLLTARVDASESLLYLLNEPETGLSPQRQMALLCLLDELHRDARSQALVASLADFDEPSRLRSVVDRSGRYQPEASRRYPALARHEPAYA